MKPSCVQIGSTSYHTISWKTADFPRHVRQDLNWNNEKTDIAILVNAAVAVVVGVL